MWRRNVLGSSPEVGQSNVICDGRFAVAIESIVDFCGQFPICVSLQKIEDGVIEMVVATLDQTIKKRCPVFG